MKKFVLISLVSIALTGCGEDKITKEYLVGDWRCTRNEYWRHDSGANEDMGDPVSSIEDTRTFRIINNELYLISEDDGNVLMDLSKANADKDEISETYRTHIKNLIKVINKDTFKSIITKDNKDINNDTNIIDISTKIETTCTRIK